MAKILANANATIVCSHGAPGVIDTNSNVKVKLSNTLGLANITGHIVNCPFAIAGPTLSPCKTFTIMGTSVKIKYQNLPAILNGDSGLAVNPGDLTAKATITVPGQVKVLGI